MKRVFILGEIYQPSKAYRSGEDLLDIKQVNLKIQHLQQGSELDRSTLLRFRGNTRMVLTG